MGEKTERGRGGDAGTGRHGDAGTGRHGDAGTRGRGDTGTRRRGDGDGETAILRVPVSPRLRVSYPVSVSLIPSSYGTLYILSWSAI